MMVENISWSLSIKECCQTQWGMNQWFLDHLAIRIGLCKQERSRSNAADSSSENDCRNDFMINPKIRMLQDPAGIKPATFWSPARGTSDWATEASLFLISPNLWFPGKAVLLCDGSISWVSSLIILTFHVNPLLLGRKFTWNVKAYFLKKLNKKMLENFICYNFAWHLNYYHSLGKFSRRQIDILLICFFLENRLWLFMQHEIVKPYFLRMEKYAWNVKPYCLGKTRNVRKQGLLDTICSESKM